MDNNIINNNKKKCVRNSLNGNSASQKFLQVKS